MPLPLVFHDDYSPPLPPGHRFPMEKFRLLRDHLVSSGLTTDAAILRPELCATDILTLAHDRSYVERYCSGDMSRDELRRLGLPWSPRLAQRTVRAVGGSLLAADLALEHGLACHLAGGTHHAHYDHASGFCIFNDLAIIALSLLESGRVGRVLIFDCDVHQGDGTARILEQIPDAITVSLHCEKNFPARKARSDWDIGLAPGMGDQEYLKVLNDTLNYLLPLYQPDLVLKGLFPFRPRPRRSLFLREARHEERSLVAPNKRRETPHRAKTGPALRVARQMSPCGVAGLGKGATITCVPRLAWRHLTQQRGSRRNGNRP